ncbi:MAG: GTP-binding protein [Lachnospiraceae bacterium]|nr:GTP-binding protein [Lachnospiraceae bacterium]
MTKIDIVSGFLGAGKTTLIKKLIGTVLKGTKVVLIENEFGEIGIDGGFLKESGIEIKEMNSGCICCSLVGDFGTSLKEVLSKYDPDRILIEPSGVGKLSDVMKAVKNAMEGEDVELGSAVAVVDGSKSKMYIKNFGEFYINQIQHAGTIMLTRTDKMDEEKIRECVEEIRKYNEKATIITTPLDELDGKEILDTIEGAGDLESEMMEEVMKLKEEHHHHDHDGCCHHHHDDDDDDECCHHHHDDDDDDECCHHHHEDDDDDDDECCHHEHHGHHHADEIFTSWGIESPKKYSADDVNRILNELDDTDKYGIVLRAKGMVPSKDGGDKWVYFDYVPEESEIRSGKPDVTGKICVIGSKLNEDNLSLLFA